MMGSKPIYPRSLPLFEGLSDGEAGGIAPACGVDTELALTLARMEFLRSWEKLRLANAAGSIDVLLAMGASEVQATLARALEPGLWKPAFYRNGARADAEYFAVRGIRLVTVADAAYPPQLREVYRPPFALYVRGRLPDPEKPAVGVVGTRVPTGRGLRAAYELAAELSAAGICVVSGLARGIDAAAHRGALRGAGKTLAVLPGGIESVYPASNRSLAAAIIESGGALATEYPPGTGIQRYRFPERNRIIAGMSRSCVVVEAPAGSGALITADHALTEGRDVFVHGACSGGSRNSGADALASQGAVIVNNAGDIFSEWSSGGRAAAARRPRERVGD